MGCFFCLSAETHDSWADIDNKFYERVAEYRNKGVKVTVAIGGNVKNIKLEKKD